MGRLCHLGAIHGACHPTVWRLPDHPACRLGASRNIGTHARSARGSVGRIPPASRAACRRTRDAHQAHPTARSRPLGHLPSGHGADGRRAAATLCGRLSSGGRAGGGDARGARLALLAPHRRRAGARVWRRFVRAWQPVRAEHEGVAFGCATGRAGARPDAEPAADPWAQSFDALLWALALILRDAHRGL